MFNKTSQYIKPRYKHRGDLFMWNVIAHESSTWSVWDGLEFSDYYYVQHKLFKRIKRVKCFGYKPEQHPEYKVFCEKWKYKIK